MKHSVLLVHSAGPQEDHQGSAELVASLRKGLGSTFDVRFPQLPHPENPKYDAWRQGIQKELGALPDRVVLVGHSLGGSVLLKYLAEDNPKATVVSLHILSAPFWGEEGWRFDEFVLAENASTSLARFARVFLYHDRDDEEVPFSHLAHHAALLPQAVVRELNGYGHEYRDGCPELTADINSVVRATTESQ